MMEKNRGWIKLHRDILKHWVFDNAEYLKAWITLLIMANHKTKKWLVNESLIIIKRGQIVTSMEKLGIELKWSRNKVRHFLNLLEKDSMIHRDSNHNYTHLSICNYDTYQNEQPTEGTTEGTTKHQSTTNRRTQLKNVKNVNNDKNVNTRREKFELEVLQYKETYPEMMLGDFISYWTELNRSQTKMKYELQNTWETSKRLANWARRSTGDGSGKNAADIFKQFTGKGN